MARYHPLHLPDDPKLEQNIMHFARALRRAGLPIGTGRVIDAIEAVSAAGFTKKQDFYWTLHACFVSRPESRAVFDQTFRLFWRDPQYLEHMMALMLPSIGAAPEKTGAVAAEKRAAEALLDGEQPQAPIETPLPQDEAPMLELDWALTASAQERLKSMDFEQMNLEEIAEAKAMLARLELPIPPLMSRRWQRASRRSVINRAGSLRLAQRSGGELHKLAYQKPRVRWPNLVVLCDISGSMSRYSRMVLHFLHAVSNQKQGGWAHVYGFTFGTRLTNISRHLQTSDVDTALAAAGVEAQDWEGGTRIASCLQAFNRDWGRRVLGQGAVVLLITDGLERDVSADLGEEMRRLQRTARRLIWLNPLLRWDEFSAKAAGIRAILPYVDSLRASHSIASLMELAEVVSAPDDVGAKTRILKTMA